MKKVLLASLLSLSLVSSANAAFFTNTQNFTVGPQPGTYNYSYLLPTGFNASWIVTAATLTVDSIINDTPGEQFFLNNQLVGTYPFSYPNEPALSFNVTSLLDGFTGNSISAKMNHSDLDGFWNDESSWDTSLNITYTVPVPEPASLTLLGLGLAGLGFARRKKQQAA